MSEEQKVDEKLIGENVKSLYNALCVYGELPGDMPTEVGYIMTSHRAIEYAAIVAKTMGINRESFMESVGDVWEGVTGEKNIVIAKSL